MKNIFRSVGLLAFLPVLMSTQAVQAEVKITVQETGGNVTFTFTGSLNPGTPGAPQLFGQETDLDPFEGDIEAWQTNSQAVDFNLTAATPFGSQNLFGNGVGTGTNIAIFNDLLYLDASYVAGAPINSTLTFSGANLTALGVSSRLEPYVWKIVETGDTISMIFPGEIALANAPLIQQIKKLNAKIKTAKRKAQKAKVKKLQKQVKKLQRQLLPVT